MPAWSEPSLRAAASWQAFKEGSGLFQAGAVTDVKVGESGWQGGVKGGKRPFRVKVEVRSASDFEVRCSCTENQRSGAVCAHAVATGLAALVPQVVDAKTSRATWVDDDICAWEIRLPGMWRKALGSGRLSATVKPLDGEKAEEADRRLSVWLSGQQLKSNQTHVLALQGGMVSGFLACLTGHPGVHVDGLDDRLEISHGARLRLLDLIRDGNTTRLVPDPGDGVWMMLGGCLWRFGDTVLEQAGSGGVVDLLVSELAELAGGKPITVPVMDFLRNANDWREVVEFPADCWVGQLHVRPAAHRVILSLDGTSRQLRARLSICYEGTGECVPGDGLDAGFPRLEGDVCWQRDVEGEREAVQQLEGYGFARAEGGSWVLTGEGPVSAFLGGARSWLRQEWDWSESTAVRKIAEETAIVAPRIEIRGSGEDWLSFTVDYRTDDGEALDPSEVRRLIQGARVTTKRGKVCQLAEGAARAWEPLLAELDAQQDGGEYIVDARAGLVVDEMRRRFSGKSPEQPADQGYAIPDTFSGTLRGYQTQGAAWLEDRTRRFGGAILADDMGLGKTVQTIAWAEALLTAEREANVLVLATTSLLGNWQAEWGRFAPRRVVRILHGAAREKERGRLGVGEVWITSHATLVRDLAWYLRQEFAALVVDEASLLRNPDTDQAKAVRKIQARRKVALTGTPVENSVRDLWSLFSWVQPGWLGSREAFRDRFEQVTKSDSGEREVALTQLRMRVAPFVLRRTKERVAPELPSKIVINEFCDMGAEQAKLYATIAREGRRLADAAMVDGATGASRMAVLTTLLRLRQVSCDPSLIGNDQSKHSIEKIDSIKHRRLIEILEQSIVNRSKILIFSQFQKQLLNLENKIRAAGWDSLRLDGQTRNRMELVQRFQSTDGPPVFLISLKAGGYGLNLTAADVVIHMDPWWNPAAEDQASDRAHRIGQLRPVTVVRLLTRGTVEEAVLRLQERKRSLSGVIDEAGGGDPAGWTMEDLCGLLS